jgi:DNA-binding HxlR family transcriptional regulator
MKGYGQFCPIAKAAEILAERWTLLIVRELLSGSTRFNALERGLPGIPRALLAKRLRSLAQAGIVEHRQFSEGAPAEYRLTPTGEELRPLVMGIGEWGQRWLNDTTVDEELDTDLLMWDIHRRINTDVLPDHQVVMQVEFSGARQRTYWLVLEREEPSVCYEPPNFDVDVVLEADTMALHRVWLGRLDFHQACRSGALRLEGPRELVRAIPDWLALSTFAGIPSAREQVR